MSLLRPFFFTDIHHCQQNESSKYSIKTSGLHSLFIILGLICNCKFVFCHSEAEKKWLRNYSAGSFTVFLSSSGETALMLLSGRHFVYFWFLICSLFSEDGKILSSRAPAHKHKICVCIAPPKFASFKIKILCLCSCWNCGTKMSRQL